MGAGAAVVRRQDRDVRHGVLGLDGALPLVVRAGGGEGDRRARHRRRHPRRLGLHERRLRARLERLLGLHDGGGDDQATRRRRGDEEGAAARVRAGDHRGARDRRSAADLRPSPPRPRRRDAVPRVARPPRLRRVLGVVRHPGAHGGSPRPDAVVDRVARQLPQVALRPLPRPRRARAAPARRRAVGAHELRLALLDEPHGSGGVRPQGGLGRGALDAAPARLVRPLDHGCGHRRGRRRALLAARAGRVAGGGVLAAAARRAAVVSPLRRRGQQPARRRRPRGRARERRRAAGRIRLRPARPRPDGGWQDADADDHDRGDRGPVGGRGQAGRPLLHVPGPGWSCRHARPGAGRALGRVVGRRHRLHREARRRAPRRHRAQPRRRDRARPLPRLDPPALDATRAGRADAVLDRPLGPRAHVPARPPDQARDQLQQLPALRPQHQHGPRARGGRGRRRGHGRAAGLPRRRPARARSSCPSRPQGARGRRGHRRSRDPRRASMR